MAKMDPNKRKFLKHLGLLGFGALLGLGIAHATSPSESDIITNLSNKEIEYGRKRIWENKREKIENIEPEPHEVRIHGLPFVLENVCAYHIDDNGDGEYEDSEISKYCTMPCRDVCPVKDSKGKKAIEKHRIQTEGTLKGKIIPEVIISKCIGCAKCFRICGYNAIEWFNYRD